MATIANLIQSHHDKCLAHLGHRPGPGYDILIAPTNPVSSRWKLDPQSPAGNAYLERVRNGNVIVTNNSELNQLKANLQEWGLSFMTDWSCIKVMRSDP